MKSLRSKRKMIFNMRRENKLQKALSEIAIGLTIVSLIFVLPAVIFA